MRRTTEDRIAEVLAGFRPPRAEFREHPTDWDELHSEHEGCDGSEASDGGCECGKPSEPKRLGCRWSSNVADEDGVDDDGPDYAGRHVNGAASRDEIIGADVRSPSAPNQVLPGVGPSTITTTACDPIDTSGNRFRVRKPPGYGTCNANRTAQVRQAYDLAYRVIRAAETEIDYLAGRVLPLERRMLWEANDVINEDASLKLVAVHSLQWWFGGAFFPDFAYRVHMVQHRIRAWSRCFREGFSDSGPVTILCKKKGESCPKSITARHIDQDKISLCPRWWTFSREERAISLLHEMGHHSGGSIYHPRDERISAYCSGGWNPAKNMCYRGPRMDAEGICGQTDDGCQDGVYFSGSPRYLVDAFEQGSDVAKSKLLNNIDNYICWMWNRWVARGTCIHTVPEAKVP